MSEDEADYLDQCRRQWQQVSPDVFRDVYVEGPNTPFPKGVPGIFVPFNFLANALVRILFDMYWRRRIEEGEVPPEPGDDLRDPFRAAGPAHAEAS